MNISSSFPLLHPSYLKYVLLNNKKATEARDLGSSGQVQRQRHALGHKDILICHWEASGHKELDCTGSACCIHPLQGWNWYEVGKNLQFGIRVREITQFTIRQTTFGVIYSLLVSS